MLDFHHQLPISRVWGEGIASSSDGQRFGIQQSSLLAFYYPRYFGYYERAVTVYTHTSDQYSVHVIPNGTYRFSDEEEPERMYAAS
jgi:TnpA family transposase